MKQQGRQALDLHFDWNNRVGPGIGELCSRALRPAMLAKYFCLQSLSDKVFLRYCLGFAVAACWITLALGRRPRQSVVGSIAWECNWGSAGCSFACSCIAPPFSLADQTESQAVFGSPHLVKSVVALAPGLKGQARRGLRDRNRILAWGMTEWVFPLL